MRIGNENIMSQKINIAHQVKIYTYIEFTALLAIPNPIINPAAPAP